MTQEDKELLLKDLCGRLPYGVKGQAKSMIIKVSDEPWTLTDINVKLNRFGADLQINIPLYNRMGECNFKPYLFPMSSMTEEQQKELEDTLIEMELKAISDEIKRIDVAAYEIDFYNKHHIDYRGLIVKGLALDATGMSIY